MQENLLQTSFPKSPNLVTLITAKYFKVKIYFFQIRNSKMFRGTIVLFSLLATSSALFEDFSLDESDVLMSSQVREWITIAVGCKEPNCLQK